MMKKLTKAIITCLMIGSIGSGAYYYQAQNAQQEMVYTTDMVRKGNIKDVVLSNGVLYPNKLVNVGAQVSGEIEQIAVELGQEVQQGELIGQIDSLTQQNELKEALASLDSIEAQIRAKQAMIKKSTSTFERYKSMLSNKASSQADYDSAEAELAIYEAELDQLVAEKQKAEINVDTTRLNLSYTTIDAPMSGTVVYVSVEEGQTVNTNQSTPSIVEISDLDTMVVRAQISEADVIHVSEGQQAYFSILGESDTRFSGVLRSIEPGPTLMNGDDSNLEIGDSDAIYYNARFEVQNPDRLLRIGMTAQVSIVLDSADDALMIPAQILQNSGKDGFQVPVIQGGKVELRQVEVGLNNNIYAEITSGLQEGDEVVVGQASSTASSDMPIRGQGPMRM
ncbi:efflux RND transporter periplasmic adaptor subunit [Vibrio splendidus]|uniref:efflux RND transporter periplasmic adaptor subunit n=1 Tax=Vibrio splendidus TaxID=29497 RepID=UPI0038B3D9F7